MRFQTFAPKEGWTVDNTELQVWEERDRLHLCLSMSEDRFSTMGGFEVASWWDDDARSMIEDGFFDPRNLHASIVEYANEVKLRAVVG